MSPFTLVSAGTRERSLITGRGRRLQNGRGGGPSEVLPLEKGWAVNVLAMLKGRGQETLGLL